MITKISHFINYFKYLKNPISCLLFKFGLKNEVNVQFKYSDMSYKISDEKLLNRLMTFIPVVNKKYVDEYVLFISELVSSKEVISWGDVKIFNFSNETNFDENPFYEYFMNGHYRSFDINYKNRTVIDIGSYVGDTALFFASRGANVYGFEPVRKHYNYSLKLAELNSNINKRLHFFNFGVSDKPGKICIDSMESTSEFRKSNDSYEVDIITLDDILSEYNLKPDILKMDCEGCEFNIILNTDLSNFSDIIFEHHSILVGKNYEMLIKKLNEQGFKIKFQKNEFEKFEDYGLIYAYK